MNAENLAKLRAELTRDEAERLVAYKDSEGLWTIGVGHLIDDGLAEPRVKRITRAESQAWLSLDIEEAWADAKRLVPAITYWAEDDPSFRAHNQSRARAIVNMAFNMGYDRLGGFHKFLAAVNNNQWVVAAVEMMDSKWATQAKARAERLRQMILTED